MSLTAVPLTDNMSIVMVKVPGVRLALVVNVNCPLPAGVRFVWNVSVTASLSLIIYRASKDDIAVVPVLLTVNSMSVAPEGTMLSTSMFESCNDASPSSPPPCVKMRMSSKYQLSMLYVLPSKKRQNSTLLLPISAVLIVASI